MKAQIARMGERVKRVLLYAADGETHVREDRKTLDAIAYNLECLGHCVAATGSECMASLAPAIDWTRVAGLRHLFAPDRPDIKHETIWSIIVTELPPLRAALDELLEGSHP